MAQEGGIPDIHDCFIRLTLQNERVFVILVNFVLDLSNCLVNALQLIWVPDWLDGEVVLNLRVL